MTLDIYVFIALAALAVIASIFIFLQKRLIHAVLFLAIVFVSSSIIFLLLGQTLIAVLQMLIFVGGLSTYLIVAVATEEKGANLISIKWLLALSIVLSIGLSASILVHVPSQNAPSPSGFLGAASRAFSNSYAMLYMILVLLFSVSISGVLVLRKFTRLLV